jgi:predicted acetyltransferase
MFISASFKVESNFSINYTDYHKAIIRAEELCFVNDDISKGLQVFDSVFNAFDFVFHDDCLEAAKVAAVANKDKFVLNFLAKACSMGVPPSSICNIQNGCLCQTKYYEGMTRKDTILQKYVAKNNSNLQAVYKKGIQHRILQLDTISLRLLHDRHVLEQFYKGSYVGISESAERQQLKYDSVVRENTIFIRNRFIRNAGIGEKNLGIFIDSWQQYSALQLPNNFELCEQLKRQYPKSPLLCESKSRTDIFDVVPYSGNDVYEEGYSPMYVIMYHSKTMFDELAPFAKKGVRDGYLHPREYFMLARFSSIRKMVQAYKESCIMQLDPKPKNRVAADSIRALFVLPSVAVDSAKHAFAHKYGCRLNLGFLRTCR